MLRRSCAVFVMLIAAAFLSGCGGEDSASAAGGTGGKGGRGGAASGGPGGGGERGGVSGAESLPVRQVRVTKAELAPLSRTVVVSGTLAADEEAELGMKVAGRLASVSVDLGDRVRRGQPIARVSPTDYQLRIRQAETALEQARVRLGLKPGTGTRSIDPAETAVVRQAAATLNQARVTRDRLASLFEQELIPRQELDAAEANLLVADARHQEAIEEARSRQATLAQRVSDLELARQQLADTVLTAPFDGIIRERRAGPGDYVAVGAPVFVLVRVDPLRLQLAVPEREATGVRVGQPVRLTVEGSPATHTGRVARMSPAISEVNRTLLVEAEVPNPSGQLRPGAFARAEIVTQSDEPAVLVPATSVVTFAGIEKLLGVEGGHAVEKRVRTGRRAGDRIEIVEGAAAGDTVVVEPGNLVGGQPVSIVP